MYVILLWMIIEEENEKWKNEISLNENYRGKLKVKYQNWLLKRPKHKKHPCLTHPRKSAPHNPHWKNLAWGLCGELPTRQNLVWGAPHQPHTKCILFLRPHAIPTHFDISCCNPHTFCRVQARKIRKSGRWRNFEVPIARVIGWTRYLSVRNWLIYTKVYCVALFDTSRPWIC